MGLIDAIKKTLGRQGTRRASPDAGAGAAPTRRETAGEDLVVPEVTAAEVMAELTSGEGGPLLLDIREKYERAQVRIPDSLHIPMNSVPARLAELDPGQDIVVYCAHGNRSYGVSGWLIQNGYKARSLKGGITNWQLQGGTVDSGYRSTSGRV